MRTMAPRPVRPMQMLERRERMRARRWSSSETEAQAGPPPDPTPPTALLFEDDEPTLGEDDDYLIEE